MITQKINLAALKSVIRELPGKNGKVECLIIPVKENRLYKGQKGIYLDIVAFETDPSKRPEGSKDTHILKQSFSKEVREKMSEEELQSLPILGNMTDWEHITQTNTSDEIPPAGEMEMEGEDGLPF